MSNCLISPGWGIYKYKKSLKPPPSDHGFGFLCIVVLAVVLKRRGALMIKKQEPFHELHLIHQSQQKLMAETFAKLVRFRAVGQTSSHSGSTFPGTKVFGTKQTVFLPKEVANVHRCDAEVAQKIYSFGVCFPHFSCGEREREREREKTIRDKSFGIGQGNEIINLMK